MTTRIPVRARRKAPTRRLSGGVAAAVAIAALIASSLALAPAQAAESVLNDSSRPAQLTDPDNSAVELGVKFSSATDIVVTGIRFYKGPDNTGRHVGTLWDSSRKAVASVVFSNETASGWQQALFATPVPVAAGESMVASYVAPNGRYSADAGGFSAPVTDGTVTFPAGAGVYNYTPGGFPTTGYEDSNYYVDLVYTTAGPSDPQAPAEPVPTEPSTPPVDPGQPDAVLDLPREPWWGGPSYYAGFDKANTAGWDEASFFPISVFYGKPEHAKTLAGIGVNTYLGAEHDGSDVSTMTARGISVIAQSEWTPAEVGDDPRVVGWHVSDECDMGLGGCDAPDDEFAQLAIQQGFVDELSAYNDGRFLQANYGNGVLGSYWSNTTMDDHLALVDVSSVDKYAYSSPHVRSILPGSPYWPVGKATGGASSYGWLQDRMETFSSPAGSKPNWIFVETAMPYLTERGAKAITNEQIGGAVWNGIIHGAAGISYFQHNNSGCGNYSLIECGASLRTAVKDINAEVKSLAPVINTQSYVWNFGPQLETALKTQGGYAYVFAMTDGSTGDRTLTLPAGLGGSVEVVGEGRTIPVANGSFTDSFPSEATHHVYRIALD
jgi:hypothetical protein